MKKYLLVFTLFLFACGNDSNSNYIPITQKPKPVCIACLGWTAPQPCGETTCSSATIIWTSSDNPLPACNASTCDSNKFNCTSFVDYSTWSIYDQAQCQ